MPHWVPPYKTRRVTRILSFAVKQNFSMLEHGGEVCYLLQRKHRLNAPTNVKDDRIVPTLTHTASSYVVDSDTGLYKTLLWEEGDSVDEYPDTGVITCTVTPASGGTVVYQKTPDKYTFINGRAEFACEIIQNELDISGNPVDDAVYAVFNSPPFSLGDTAVFTFGKTNPQINPNSMQPYVDNQPGYELSGFGFEQWTNSSARVRRKVVPNGFLVAFPGVMQDVLMTDQGLLQESTTSYWTTPPPYSPRVAEHDIVVRPSTGQRYQVTNLTPIFLENKLVSQHFDLAEVDPRSSIYDIIVEVV